jgi:hypothetical protein
VIVRTIFSLLVFMLDVLGWLLPFSSFAEASENNGGLGQSTGVLGWETTWMGSLERCFGVVEW